MSYNNRGTAKQTAYTEVYGDAADDTGILVLSAAADDTNSGPKAESASFPVIPTGVVGLTDNTGTDGVDESKVAGTFHGIQGYFHCPSGTCTVTRDATGGSVTFSGDPLTFTPDLTGTTLAALMVGVPDDDYLRFGFWKNTSMKDGKPVFMVEGFYHGTELPATIVDTLEGMASYAGPATGKYVRKTFTVDGDPEHLYSGQFTADASLTAYFVGGDVPQNKHNSVEGTINNFMADGESIDDGWSVTLKSVVADGETTGITAAGVVTGTTEGDKGMMGAWEGQFYGEVVLDTDATATNPVAGHQSQLPSGISGAFNGHFVNGHVLGAFGASKQ